MTEQDKELQELRRVNQELALKNVKLAAITFLNDEYVYTDEDKETIQKAINEYGAEAQVVVAMEEMAELIKELSKAYRGKANVSAITEEIADVKIMVRQMQEVFKITGEEVNKQMSAKLNRLKERLTEDYSWVNY